MISKTFKAKTEFDYDLNIYTITSCENFEFGKYSFSFSFEMS